MEVQEMVQKATGLVRYELKNRLTGEKLHSRNGRRNWATRPTAVINDLVAQGWKRGDIVVVRSVYSLERVDIEFVD